MEQEASKFIEFITETLKNTESFVVEQAPAFIQQYLEYWFVVHSMWAGLFFLINLAGWVFMVFLFKKREEAIIAAFWINLILHIPLVWQITKLIKIWIAPKVYLFDSFSHFLH